MIRPYFGRILADLCSQYSNKTQLCRPVTVFIYDLLTSSSCKVLYDGAFFAKILRIKFLAIKNMALGSSYYIFSLSLVVTRIFQNFAPHVSPHYISMKRHFLLGLSFVVLLLSGCQRQAQEAVQPDQAAVLPQESLSSTATGFPEGFESGSKTSYATGDVTFGSGTWTLNDALLGTTSGSDRFNGTKSVRMRNSGILTMKFNVANGASQVTVAHAKYGTDANSSWGLFASTNNGSTWQQVGTNVSTTGTTLTTQTFSGLTFTGNVRFEIRKLDGTSARLNIDDVSITNASGSSGGGGGGGGTTPPPGTPTRDNNIALGNPSGAVTNASTHANNYLMIKPQYVLSYSNARKTANWVSWHLSAAWKGSATRQDDFRPDPALPSAWYAVPGSGFSGSGFDRGHSCPSDDRDGSASDNSATFLMTNMMPQAPRNNQQTWQGLELYLQNLALNGWEMYIICGAYGQGGDGSNGFANTIGSAPNQITVPNRTWKVVVLLPNGSNDVSRITTATRVIAVDMPNSQSIVTGSGAWGQYRTSVDAIERATGYDLFSNIPANIQSILEARVDNGPTN